MYPLKNKELFWNWQSRGSREADIPGYAQEPRLSEPKPCCFHGSRRKHSDDSKAGSEHLLDSYSLPVIWYAPGDYTSQNFGGRATQTNNLRLSNSSKSSVSELRFVPWSVWFQNLFYHRQSNFCRGGGRPKNLLLGMCLSSAACLF